jgi:hypothetical protein
MLSWFNARSHATVRWSGLGVGRRKVRASPPSCALPRPADRVRGPREWQGYHAVRLSEAYRAIYTKHSDGTVEAVYVEEVNKHDY